MTPRPHLIARKAAQELVVDIADMKTSDDPAAVIVTYALGSCIAVVLHDPTRKVGGMIHYMLPLSEVAPDKAEQKPAMFADTGVPILFKTMYELGCRKENLVVKAVGGGKLFEASGLFDIGRRNYVVLRKIFWKNGVLIAAEDVGGNVSRTVRLTVETGQVVVRSQGREVEL
jgi:chemotaxis protein CheD